MVHNKSNIQYWLTDLSCQQFYSCGLSSILAYGGFLRYNVALKIFAPVGILLTDESHCLWGSVFSVLTQGTIFSCITAQKVACLYSWIRTYLSKTTKMANITATDLSGIFSLTRLGFLERSSAVDFFQEVFDWPLRLHKGFYRTEELMAKQWRN